VFALDTLKGAVAAGWPLLLAALWSSGVRQSAGAGGPPVASMVVPATHQLALVMGYVGLGFALVGHSFSCFTGFRGGKGVSTAAGGFLVLLPCVALISSAVWVLVFYPTRYVSLASILAALCLPLFAIILGSGAIATWVTAVVALFVVVRHRANVKRLLTGTEKKFERKKPDGPPPGAKP
jgi:glycerol-3-phosphate acyltransferase PlsY